MIHSLTVAALFRRFALVLLACLVAGPWLSAQPAWAQGAAVDEATAGQKKAAQREFNKAMTAFRAKRFDEALAGFRASYDIVTSPNTRLMVVHVLVDMGKTVPAYWEAQATVEAAEAAAARDKRYVAAAKSARRELARMRARIGLVTVHVSRPAGSEEPAEGDGELTLTVAGQELDPADWGQPLAVKPGPCEIVLLAETGSASKEVTVSAGGSVEVTIAPPHGRLHPTGEPRQPQPDDPSEGVETSDSSDGSGLRTAAYVAGGLGVAGMAVFAISGSLATSNYDELVEQCPGDRCPADLESQADTTRSQQTAANVGLVVGVVGLAAGVALLVTSFVLEGGSAEPQPEVAVSMGPGSLVITGSF